MPCLQCCNCCRLREECRYDVGSHDQALILKAQAKNFARVSASDTTAAAVTLAFPSQAAYILLLPLAQPITYIAGYHFGLSIFSI